jgi:hypothetical protein
MHLIIMMQTRKRLRPAREAALCVGGGYQKEAQMHKAAGSVQGRALAQSSSSRGDHTAGAHVGCDHTQHVLLSGGAGWLVFCCVHIRARRCMQGPPHQTPPCVEPPVLCAHILTPHTPGLPLHG